MVLQTVLLNAGASGNTFVIAGQKYCYNRWHKFLYKVTSTGGSAWNCNSNYSFNSKCYSGQNFYLYTSSNTITVTLLLQLLRSVIKLVLDVADNFDTNALTINPNGGKVFGATANGTVSTEGAAFTLYLQVRTLVGK